MLLRDRIQTLQGELDQAQRELNECIERSEAEVAPQLPMLLSDYKRFGRQMILEGFGLPAQLKLRQASVLVVGAGGLGCPAIQYLARAGVGTIGIVDSDVVELSNLARQILHTDATIGWNKAQSAKRAALKSVTCIYAGSRVVPYETRLSSQNAADIIQPFDVVLDCSDNLPTRYLISDMAVRFSKPIVSGAALKLEGQLCVYNSGPTSPCYRCVFPKAAPKQPSATCEEAGVLGTVTGVIGTLQALEAIKLILGLGDGQPSMLLFSALQTPAFRQIKLRSRNLACHACRPGQPAQGVPIANEDYEAFCGGPDFDGLTGGYAPGGSRVSAEVLSSILQEQKTIPRLLDVRPAPEFSICHLPTAINVPLPDLLRNPQAYSSTMQDSYVICRLGNDSQLAVTALQSVAAEGSSVKDLVGGLRAWSTRVDPAFPIY